MAGALIDLVERTGLLRLPLADGALRAAGGLPRSAWGTAFAHFGLGLTLLGIVGAGTWGTERIVALQAGRRRCRSSGYDLTFDGLAQQPGPELYRELVATFTVREGGSVDRRDASRRSASSPRAAATTTEAALMTRGVEPALSFARRHQCRRLGRRAALL